MPADPARARVPAHRPRSRRATASATTWATRSKPGQPTLQGLLRARGYATGAAVSAYVMRGDTGLREGFDFYDDVPVTGAVHGVRGSRPARRARRPRPASWSSRGARRGRPLFLFLHLYEPHLPYEPPAPFRSAAAHPYDGEIAAADAVVGDFLAALDQSGLLRPRARRSSRRTTARA